jgi:hypothetical protein
MIRTLQQHLSLLLLLVYALTGSYSSSAQDTVKKDRDYSRDRNRSFSLFSDSASATQADYMLHLENAQLFGICNSEAR